MSDHDGTVSGMDKAIVDLKKRLTIAEELALHALEKTDARMKLLEDLLHQSLNDLGGHSPKARALKTRIRATLDRRKIPS